MSAMISKIANLLIRSKAHHIINSIRIGWNNYSFLFYIGGISTIIGGVIGIAAAPIAIILTLVIFYYLGQLHVKLQQKQAGSEAKT